MATAATSLPAPSSAQAWLLAIRPKTLTAGFVPVAVGTGLAFGRGVGKVLPAFAALLGALFIQIATNLLNDYYDFKKGADTHERLGPTRATQSGLLTPGEVMTGAILAGALAVMVGFYLVAVAGWPVLAIGVLSLASGFAYTGGPYPLGYHGLGDLFVFVFFGLVAVGGTYFVQAGTLAHAVWPAAVAIGAMGTLLLVVNNLRDVRTDAKAGKRTLAVLFGERAGKAEYVALLVVAYLMPILLFALGEAKPWVLGSLLSLPLAVAPLRVVLRQEGATLNTALGGTARLQLAFGVLLALGLWGGGR
jgi:1,4-dihydroxy-2-naphthoate octaprenyltransferase